MLGTKWFFVKGPARRERISPSSFERHTMTGLLCDYSNQARGYDSTRAASPSLLAPLLRALTGAPGKWLLDLGGGTGNYALALREEGFEPLVADRSQAMLRRAQGKGLATLLADAESLPLGDESFDAVMLVSMLHHVRCPPHALAEAVRVLAPGGPLALMLFTWEDVKDTWVLDYLGARLLSLRARLDARDAHGAAPAARPAAGRCTPRCPLRGPRGRFARCVAQLPAAPARGELARTDELL
jgi:SAM-dependent methyltransferase